MKAKNSALRYRRSFTVLTSAVLALSANAPLGAATKTWNTTSGSLSASGSWSLTGTPATTDEALFDGTVTPAASINTAAGTNLTFGDLIWNNNTSSTLQMNTSSNSTSQLRLSGLGGSMAAIAAGGATGDLLLMGTNATNNTLTISAVNLGIGTAQLRPRLDASGNFNVVNSGATLSIQTEISESGARTLTKTGAGQLILGNANTFTGGVVLNAGTIAVGSSTALGGGGLTINAGTIGSVTSTRTLANNVTVGGNFALGLGAGGQSINLNGTTDLGNAVRSITLNNSATFNGIISNGGLNVTDPLGTRTLTLAGDNTYSGGTTINSGTLRVNNTTGSGTGSGNVTIAAGAALGGNGTISGSVTASGATLGIVNSTLTVSGSLFTSATTTFVSGATINVSGSTAVSSGNFTVNGSLGGGALNVSGTAILRGNGTVSGATTVASGAFIAPGNSPGNITFNNGLTLAGTYNWELAALSTSGPGTNFDTITVTAGNVDITGASMNLILGAFAPSADPFWTSNQIWSGIINNSGLGSIAGTFGIIDNTSWSTFGAFTTAINNNDVNLVWTAIPEPSSYAVLAGFGALGLAALRRRRQS